MEFVRQIARTVTVLHQGPCSARARWSRSRATRGCSRSTSASARTPMLSVEKLDVAYGGSQVLWGVDLEVPDGQVVCLMGRNGVGKTTLLAPSWASCRPAPVASCSGDPDITRWSPDRRARAGHRLRAAGPRDLPAPERARRTSGWRCSAASAPTSHRRRARPLSRAQAVAVPQGRRPLGRRAAEAGHRPRAAHATRSS